jgi:heavy metal sensor kinase
MPLSLRARLTAWYSVLLVLTVAVFSAAVLSLHWRLLIEQYDQSLESIGVTADNVVRDELRETQGDFERSAAEMGAMVRADQAQEPSGRNRHRERRNFVAQVLDDRGAPIGAPAGERTLPLPDEVRSGVPQHVRRTIADAGGREWRVQVRPGSYGARRYSIVVGAPLDEAVEEWRELLRAVLVGVPLVLALAAAGGWLLGRRGLLPLTTMAAQAEAMTAQTPDRRLSVPPAGEELERLANSFNTVLERLGSALSTQRQFMADASHELRTPVSIMRTAADVTLSRPSRSEAEYREALRDVSQQTARLARLVDDMLVLARADGGGYPVVKSDVDLAAVLGGCVRELGGRAEDKGIRIQTTLDSVVVHGDEALLRRLFVNLLGNALTYTPAGGSVDVSLGRENGHALVRVADTGPGIPDADRERIFERFVRLDPARASGGAGLGLAIARWVAEAHGGQVDLVSSGTDGSVFSATIPT